MWSVHRMIGCRMRGAKTSRCECWARWVAILVNRHQSQAGAAKHACSTGGIGQRTREGWLYLPSVRSGSICDTPRGVLHKGPHTGVCGGRRLISRPGTLGAAISATLEDIVHQQHPGSPSCGITQRWSLGLISRSQSGRHFSARTGHSPCPVTRISPPASALFERESGDRNRGSAAPPAVCSVRCVRFNYLVGLSPPGSCNTRFGWSATPYPTRICTLSEAPSLLGALTVWLSGGVHVLWPLQNAIRSKFLS